MSQLLPGGGRVSHKFVCSDPAAWRQQSAISTGLKEGFQFFNTAGIITSLEHGNVLHMSVCPRDEVFWPTLEVSQYT